MAILAFVIWVIHATVYESNTSDDVEFFLEENPNENIALLFYSEEKDIDPEWVTNIANIEGIFKSAEEGGSDEAWVKDLNGQVQMMRINVSDKNNKESVEVFKVNETPFIIIFDNGIPIFDGVVNSKSFPLVKDKLLSRIVKKNDSISKQEVNQASSNEYKEPSPQQTQKAKDDSEVVRKVAQATNAEIASNLDEYEESSPSPQQIQKAIDDSEAAKKAAQEAERISDQAFKDLQESRRAFDNVMRVDYAKREEENAKEMVERVKKDFEKAKKAIADHLADDAKKPDINTQKLSTSDAYWNQKINYYMN